MKKENDELIRQLQEKVKSKKESITEVLFKPVTNCRLEIFGKEYNLHVCSVNDLKLLEVFLYSLNTEELILSNYRVGIWMDEINNKLNHLNYKIQKNDLEELQDKLNKLLSEEAKTSEELNKILKTLE